MDLDSTTVYTILSWLGALLVLIAFSLNIRKVVAADSYVYMLLNLTGSVFLAASAFTTQSYAFVVLNSIWALFAIYSLLRRNSDVT
jgi:hypothetical protein